MFYRKRDLANNFAPVAHASGTKSACDTHMNVAVSARDARGAVRMHAYAHTHAPTGHSRRPVENRLWPHRLGTPALH